VHTVERLSEHRQVSEPIMERAMGIEPATSSLGSNLSALYFQHLQIGSRKMYVHAVHTVHAVPDLRIVAGRFAGRFSIMRCCSQPYWGIVTVSIFNCRLPIHVRNDSLPQWQFSIHPGSIHSGRFGRFSISLNRGSSRNGSMNGSNLRNRT
jgi:hypothetical protein